MSECYRGEMSDMIGQTVFVRHDNIALSYCITEWNFYDPLFKRWIKEGRVFLTKEAMGAELNELQKTSQTN